MANGTADSYLTKQNGTFCYRRRVPADIQPYVGVKWWKKTLKTAKEQVAKERVRAAATEHDEIIRAIRNAPPAEQHRLVTQSIDFIDDQAQTTPDNSATRDLMKRALQAKVKLRRAMIAAAEQRLDTLPDDERNAIQQLGGVDAFFSLADRAADETEVRQIQLALMEGIQKIQPRDAEIIRAGLQTKARHAAKDQQTLERLGLLSRETVVEELDNPRINTALEKWLAERKQGVSASRRHRTAVRRFVAINGNISVRSITKAMVRDYVKRIEMLPDHRRLPSNQRGGLTDPGTGVPRIAAPTVDRHLVSIKALLKFCVEQDWLAVNVATRLKPPKDTRPKASRRRPFMRDERNQLLRHAIAVDKDKGDGDVPWLIRLAAYTACRVEELAQLARSNVRQVDGVWVIEVDDLDNRSVKNAASVKQVPLHPAIRDDFVTWVGNSTSPRVFQSFKADRRGRYVNKVSGAFGRLMDQAGLTDPRLVLHSLRHTLKREMSNAGIDPDCAAKSWGMRHKTRTTAMRGTR